MHLRVRTPAAGILHFPQNNNRTWVRKSIAIAWFLILKLLVSRSSVQLLSPVYNPFLRTKNLRSQEQSQKG